MPPHRWVVGAAAALGCSLLIASVMPVLVGFGAALVLCGGMFMTFAVLANTSVQLTAEPALRGRVVAVYLTLFLGGGALGAPLLGFLSEQFGPMRAIGLAGVFALVAAGAGAVVLVAIGLSKPAGNSTARIPVIVYQRDTEAVDP
jgi:MFS family permease